MGPFYTDLQPVRLVLWATLAAALLACDAPAQPPASQASPAAGESPGIGARPRGVLGELGGPAAFELLNTVGGALLLWAPGPCEAGIHAQPLDSAGRVRGGARTLVPDACPGASTLDPARAQVTELAAAAGGGRLGLTWIAELGSSSLVYAAHGDDRARAVASVEGPIGPGVAQDSGGRHRISMTASAAGHLRIGYRTQPRPCVAHGEGSCAQYVSHAYPGSMPRRGGGVASREIPDPCPRMVSGAVWSSATWFDSICSGNDPPRSHVFIIRPEIAYAESVPALEGCEPLELTAVQDGALLWGRCRGHSTLRKLSPAGAGPRVDHVSVRLDCVGGRPRAELEGQGGTRLSVPFEAPLERIVRLLPASLAAPPDRAVWTGRSLLVVHSRGGRMELSALACRKGALVPTSP